MKRQELINLIFEKRSFLCVGLDSDIEKIPSILKSEPDPIFAFNKEIIDATYDYAVAYKPNMAFYESMGSKGWESLEKTMDYIKSKSKPVFTIADAKRGDIGNTAEMYAKAFFHNFSFDAVTINPYMGSNAITPFIEEPGKWAIVLALTSNKSSEDFQTAKYNENRLFEDVIIKSNNWGNKENIMFVVGATKADMLQTVRQLAPDSFLLVPGVGAQGGSLKEVCKYGMTEECGLLVNASRSIIYAGNDKDFAEKARIAALEMQSEMEMILKVKS
jgi:orotidine-5'-phosphate decarboxylase